MKNETIEEAAEKVIEKKNIKIKRETFKSPFLKYGFKY